MVFVSPCARFFPGISPDFVLLLYTFYAFRSAFFFFFFALFSSRLPHPCPFNHRFSPRLLSAAFFLRLRVRVPRCFPVFLPRAPLLPMGQSITSSLFYQNRDLCSLPPWFRVEEASVMGLTFSWQVFFHHSEVHRFCCFLCRVFDTSFKLCGAVATPSLPQRCPFFLLAWVYRCVHYRPTRGPGPVGIAS